MISCAGCAAALAPGDPGHGLEAITPATARKHIEYLASDSLMGRDTPSPGLDSAAAYIERQFLASGLLPVNGSYRKRVGLNIVALGDTNALAITVGGTRREFAIKDEFTPFDMTANKQARGPVVFAGYGITAPKYHYDDYDGIDVRGKIVFLLRHEPGENDSSSVFEGTNPTEYSNVSEKVSNAVAHGAAGVLIATDPLNHTSLAPRGFPWPSLSRIIPKDALPITLSIEEAKKVPVVQVGETFIVQLFGSVDALKNLQAHIDSSMHPMSREIPRAEATVRTSTIIRDLSSWNVVGYCPGTDSIFKNQVVVVGAHYDHLGIKKQHVPGEDYIFNGADDNASGTTGLLEVAAAFGSMPVRTRRSVLFIAFAGEEKGLLGSHAYVEEPLFPLDSTVAMLNMDMIGRNGEDSLYVLGEEESPDLAGIARDNNRRVGFTLIGQTHELGGSDHMSFLKKSIPSLFFHSGLHPEYHKVTDEASLINERKLSNVAKLVFLTAWSIANDNHRYRFIYTGPTPF